MRRISRSRPIQQVFVAEEGPGQIVRVPPVHLHLDAQQLLLVIPLVEGLALVQALVALEAHQLPVQSGGHDLGDFGFSYAGGALNEQGPAQPEGHQQGGGYVAGADIFCFIQFPLQSGDVHIVSSFVKYLTEILLHHITFSAKLQSFFCGKMIADGVE